MSPTGDPGRTLRSTKPRKRPHIIDRSSPSSKPLASYKGPCFTTEASSREAGGARLRRKGKPCEKEESVQEATYAVEVRSRERPYSNPH